jgi:glycolate oxidase
MTALDLTERLCQIVGAEHVHADPAERVAYSYDGTFQQQLPALAVSPASTEEVAAVVAACNQRSVAIIPRGAGSGLAGGTIPSGGAVVLNLARMNNVLDIDAADGVAEVQAGVVTARLQDEVERRGLFYPPDPASLNQSTIGGNVATNAGGPRCLKYGVTKDYVLGLTVVLPEGKVLRTGGRTIKNVTGYQLTQLFVGSEGTLGVIAEVVLRLIPYPRYRSTALAAFPRLDAAAEAVTTLFVDGILPVALELMDSTTIRLVEQHAAVGLPLEAEAALIMEQDGNDMPTVVREIGRMAELCRSLGASSVRVATTSEERARLWDARRAISPSLGRARPNKLGEDVAVPRGKVPDLVRRVQAISREVGLPIPVFGHAGDGNLHPNILFDRRVPGELERVEAAATAVFRAALDLGGTLSGEHGIGTLKREFLEDDLGPAGVETMHRIKGVLDPRGIMNPGKVFPQRGGADHAGFLAALPALEGIVPG